MNKMNKKILLVVVVFLISTIAIAYIFKLPPFSIVYKPSAAITVVDLNNNVVSGATVKIDETDDAWHWLGDVFNEYSMKCTSTAGFDGLIDNYDYNYTAGYYGSIDVNWTDMNGDGKVDLKDTYYVGSHIGLVRSSYPPTSEAVTNDTGQVTFDIVYTDRGIDTYAITVSKTGYSTKIVTKNINTAQTIVLEPLPTHSLTISSSSGGTTDPAPGVHYYIEGTAVSVSAIPNNGYKFSYWKLDGVMYWNNPISFTMNIDHNLEAYFETIPPPPPSSYTLTISCTSGGITDPSPGTYNYTAGSVVTITASPYSDYTFTKWIIDKQDGPTTPSLTLTIDKSYNVEAVFTLVPKPTISVLTLLKFPPSENVNVTVYVTDQNNQPMQNKMVTMSILDSSGTVLRQASSPTGSDGKANIVITSPSKSGTYNATFTVDTSTISQPLYVLPKIVIVLSSDYSKSQVYKPGSYDFKLEAQIQDTDGNMLSGYSVSWELKDAITGTAVSTDYTSLTVQLSRVVLQAKIYDWYRSINPTFQYKEEGIYVKLRVYKPETHIENTFIDTVTMKPPYLGALVPSSLPLGNPGITISIRDPYGNVPQITLDNVEVIIQTPSGSSYSTRTELVNKVTMVSGDISIAFKFEEQGEYKVVVRYYNLQWTQPDQTYNVYVLAESQPISILTNPYIIGAIVLIVLIILFRRRKK